MLRTEMDICKAIFLSFAIGFGTTAWAAEHYIAQKDRKFSASELTIHVGETVHFANTDDVPHNVISTSKNNEFDLGLQKPGVATPVMFDAPGEVKIQCLMHPRMTMVIKVKP